MCKTDKPDRTISEMVRTTSDALLSISDLNDNEDPRWHELVQVCRENLKDLTRSPSHTTDDILEKGRVLALLTSCDYLPDQRFWLAQSILSDIEEFRKGLAR